jgi:hypothetical protein
MAGLQNPFSGHGYNLHSSALDSYVPTPDDDEDLPRFSRWVYVATQGDIHFTTPEGNERTIPAVPAGLHPIPMKRLYATGTTATFVYVAV